MSSYYQAENPGYTDPTTGGPATYDPGADYQPTGGAGAGQDWLTRLTSLYQKYYGRTPTQEEIDRYRPMLASLATSFDDLEKQFDADAKAKGIGPYATTASSGTDASAGVPGVPGTIVAGTSTSSGTGGIDPSYLAPWTKPFMFDAYAAPTAESVQSDPGYQFARAETLGNLQNTAAARGLLNSGGTIYDLAKAADAVAGQGYSDAWNRGWGLYNAARDQAWKQYVEDKDTWYRNQNEPWQKLYGAASMGAGSAG